MVVSFAAVAVKLANTALGRAIRFLPSSIRHQASLRAFVALPLFLLLIACNPIQQQRMGSYGIGTELYSPDTAAAARNLEVYLGYLCWQAGFQTSGYVDFSSGEPRCVDAYMTPDQWKLIVLTGWNDIDRRCDGYLAWLDYQRRSRVFANDLFAHVSLLTTGIFAALDTGKQTISLVALSLGFGQNIYNSYQNRILIEIEGSTLETIVVDRRLDFRELITSAPIESKPAAVKVLRDYLRICTPYGIKISINTFSRSRATGAPLLENREIAVLRQSLIDSAITDATAPIRRPVVVDVVVPAVGEAERIGDQEKRLQPDDIAAFQRVVCQPADGRFTIATREAVLNYLRDNNLKESTQPPERITRTDRIDMLDAADNDPKC
jgi:hypothetical protein